MGVVVQPPPPSRTARLSSSSRVRGGLLQPPRGPSPRRGTQLNQSPGKPGRFTSCFTVYSLRRPSIHSDVSRRGIPVGPIPSASPGHETVPVNPVYSHVHNFTQSPGTPCFSPALGLAIVPSRTWHAPCVGRLPSFGDASLFRSLLERGAFVQGLFA